MSPSIARFGGELKITKQRVIMINIESVACNLTCKIKVWIAGVQLSLSCIFAKLLPVYQILLSLDAVLAMSGVIIEGNGMVWFEGSSIGPIAGTK